MRFWLASVFIVCGVSLWIVDSGFWWLELICILTGLVLFFKNVDLKRSSSSALTIFLVSCILGILNFIALKIEHSWDVSKTKINTLSEKSEAILSSIQVPITMEFYAPRAQWEQLDRLASLYKSSPQIEVLFFDPVNNIERARRKEITAPIELIISQAERMSRIFSINEINITNGLLSVLNPATRLCLYNQESESSLLLKNGVMSEASRLAKLSGISIEKVDSLKNCQAAMLISRNIDLTIKEMKELMRFDKDLFILLSPSFSSGERPHLNKFLASIGVQFTNLITVNRLSEYEKVDSATVLISDLHAGLQKLQGKLALPMAGKIQGQDFKIWASSKGLPSSWGETNLEQLRSGKALMDSEDDQKPYPLIAAIENKKRRILISASTSMFSNQWINSFNQSAAYLNMLDYIFYREYISSLDRAELRPLRLNVSGMMLELIFFFMVIVIPFGLIIFAGINLKKSGRI